MASLKIANCYQWKLIPDKKIIPIHINENNISLELTGCFLKHQSAACHTCYDMFGLNGRDQQIRHGELPQCKRLR